MFCFVCLFIVYVLFEAKGQVRDGQYRNRAGCPVVPTTGPDPRRHRRRADDTGARGSCGSRGLHGPSARATLPRYIQAPGISQFRAA